MHGKNICDVALSNLPSNAITEAIRNPVGRFHILRFSQRRPRSRKGAGDPGCRKVVQGGLVGDRAHLLRHSKFTALAVPKSATRLMASTAHTTSTCSRGTARMRPPRGRWAPDHVKLVLSRAVLIVPCRVVCRMLPHVTRPSSPPHRLPVTGPRACPPCIALQWGDCEMVAVFGKVKKQKAPRAASEAAEGCGK